MVNVAPHTHKKINTDYQPTTLITKELNIVKPRFRPQQLQPVLQEPTKPQTTHPTFNFLHNNNHFTIFQPYFRPRELSKQPSRKPKISNN